MNLVAALHTATCAHVSQTLCNLHWCTFYLQLAHILHLHLHVRSSSLCNGGVFPVATSTLTNVHTNEQTHILHFALCCGMFSRCAASFPELSVAFLSFMLANVSLPHLTLATACSGDDHQVCLGVYCSHFCSYGCCCQHQILLLFMPFYLSCFKVTCLHKFDESVTYVWYMSGTKEWQALHEQLNNMRLDNCNRRWVCWSGVTCLRCPDS